MSYNRRIEKLAKGNGEGNNEDSIDLGLLSDSEREQYQKCMSLVINASRQPQIEAQERSSRRSAIKSQGVEIVQRAELIWFAYCHLSETDKTMTQEKARRLIDSGQYHVTDAEMAAIKQRWQNEYWDRVQDAQRELEALEATARERGDNS